MFDWNATPAYFANRSRCSRRYCGVERCDGTVLDRIGEIGLGTKGEEISSDRQSHGKLC
jgi:hypothetical protein